MLEEGSGTSLLTIAVPTFNRGPKLKRLLGALEKEIIGSRLQERVEVLVSDNASIDETPIIGAEFHPDFRYQYFRQSENIGFDSNLRFLYTQAHSSYIWFLADDDLPLSGAVDRIFASLETHQPDVLLFSFVQPPGSSVRQFCYPEPVRIISDPASAIEHILRYPKVSIFVVRNIQFDDAKWRILDKNLGDGWYFISLALSTLEESGDLKVAIISEFLATCDEDYAILPWTPSVILGSYKPVQHPFVLKHNPGLVKHHRAESYYRAIQFAFAAKTGSLFPTCPEEYDRFIRELEFRIWPLLFRPKCLIQFVALKFGMAWIWSIVRPGVHWAIRKSGSS